MSVVREPEPTCTWVHPGFGPLCDGGRTPRLTTLVHVTTTWNAEDPQGLRTVLKEVVRAPWSAAAWAATGHQLIGFPIGLTSMLLLLAFGTTTALLAVTAVFAVPTLVAFLYCSKLFTRVQRARFSALLGVEIDPIPARFTDLPWLRRLLAELKSASTWREVFYHVLAGVLGTISFVLVVPLWTTGLVFGTALLHGWFLPDVGIFGLRLTTLPVLLLLTVIGLVCWFTAPWMARMLAAIDTAAAKALLEPDEDELNAELMRQVESLTESRAAALAAADSERRRIERDLHDGAQQRLVSLAMNLGMTRTTMTDVPETARKAIEQAHEEAKQALTELRDFVRGLHPAVLDELGLDAALSGIAARSAVPVRLMVDLPRRPPPAIEAVAYFVVAEALTNVAKHAHATQVDISVEVEPDRYGVDRLRLIVADNGRGGAKHDGGTGLRGLGQRIGSVDGTLRIDSPPGGPTVIVVELPCAS